MRFLLIDPDAAYRQILKYHIESAWPEARIEECAPESGPLRESLRAMGIDNSVFDVVLLGYPRDPARGHGWLLELLEGARRPPVIVFADPSDEFLAVDALKSGAASYFPKDRVRHMRLVATIAEVAEQSAAVALIADTVPTRARVRPPYDIIRELHSSNVASVYLARDPATGADVALKVIRYVPDAGSERLFDRFLQEYSIIAAIEHPNVVRILDLGIADDHAFLVMEYLENGSLAERLNSPLPVADAIATTRQIAGALVSIHAAGVLHRDLKPANIMFRSDGTLALIDFGLAKDTQLGLELTGNGQIFGTPFYMSPEQGHADPTDQRSDLYSLGCILHEMLTGRRPFVAPTAMGVIYKHAKAERPLLPAELARFQPVLDRLLAARPDDRYASAAELLGALEDPD